LLLHQRITDKNSITVKGIKMKKCTRCKVEKDLSEFGRRADMVDKINYTCKVCNNELNKAYREANPEKNKARYIANSENVIAQSKAWKAANQDRAKANNKAWYAANKEKVKASSKAWEKANPEACRIINHNRNARKRLNGGALSKGLSAKLFNLQRGLCPCCNQPLGDNYHMDHIMPISKGGKNEDWNIQLLRATCNNQKHAKDPIDFMQSRGFLL